MKYCNQNSHWIFLPFSTFPISIILFIFPVFFPTILSFLPSLFPVFSLPITKNFSSSVNDAATTAVVKEPAEPDHHTVANPARAVHRQLRALAMPADGRYRPLKPLAYGGIIMVLDTKVLPENLFSYYSLNGR
jgi:hypothetical protein